MQASHLHKRNNDPHRVNHSTRAARGEKWLGQRAVGGVGREKASRSASCKHHDAAIRAVAFSFVYIPSAPPACGYAPVYPPPWPPGPGLPR
jgi:hypothetical protein